MKTINVYSSFNRSFSTGPDASKEIQYYEIKWVKTTGRKAVCIATTQPATVPVGYVIDPEFPIELWAKRTYVERVEHDRSLKMEAQVIHYCDGTIRMIDLTTHHCISWHAEPV